VKRSGKNGASREANAKRYTGLRVREPAAPQRKKFGNDWNRRVSLQTPGQRGRRWRKVGINRSTREEGIRRRYTRKVEKPKPCRKKSHQTFEGNQEIQLSA